MQKSFCHREKEELKAFFFSQKLYGLCGKVFALIQGETYE
jgi:hypothetical protein